MGIRQGKYKIKPLGLILYFYFYKVAGKLGGADVDKLLNHHVPLLAEALLGHHNAGGRKGKLAPIIHHNVKAILIPRHGSILPLIPAGSLNFIRGHPNRQERVNAEHHVQAFNFDKNIKARQMAENRGKSDKHTRWQVGV